MRRGIELFSLWHCSGVMRAQVALIVAFSSSALLGLAYRIFLFTIPHRFSMGLRSGEFAGQLRTGIPWSLYQVLVALALCAGCSEPATNSFRALTQLPGDVTQQKGTTCSQTKPTKKHKLNHVASETKDRTFP